MEKRQVRRASRSAYRRQLLSHLPQPWRSAVSPWECCWWLTCKAGPTARPCEYFQYSLEQPRIKPRLPWTVLCVKLCQRAPAGCAASNCCIGSVQDRLTLDCNSLPASTRCEINLVNDPAEELVTSPPARPHRCACANAFCTLCQTSDCAMGALTRSRRSCRPRRKPIVAPSAPDQHQRRCASSSAGMRSKVLHAGLCQTRRTPDAGKSRPLPRVPPLSSLPASMRTPASSKSVATKRSFGDR